MNFFAGIISQEPIEPPPAFLGVESELKPIAFGSLLQPKPTAVAGIESNLINSFGAIAIPNNIDAFTGNELSLNIQFGIVLETKVIPFVEYCPQDQSNMNYVVDVVPIGYCPQDQSGMSYQVNPVPIVYCPQDQSGMGYEINPVSIAYCPQDQGSF